jgi:hypothetical protein
MDLKLLLPLFVGIFAIFAVVSAMINAASNKALRNEIDENLAEIAKLKSLLDAEMKQTVKRTDKISELDSKLSAANYVIHSKDVEIAELEGKLAATSRTNTKLLKEVADDITVNVKAGDDAPVNVQKPKRRKPYKKRKPNGGSATNNNKAGEKK